MELEELKQTILSVIKLKGVLTINYVPSEYLDSTKQLYGLYYSGSNKMTIGEYYICGRDYEEVKYDNIDEIVSKICNIMNNSIQYAISDALDNLEMETEYLKYFEDDEESYQKFKTEVLRIKTEKNENKN